MKDQILANLVAEFTEELENSKEGVRPEEAVHVETIVVQRTWKLFVDDVAN